MTDLAGLLGNAPPGQTALGALRARSGYYDQSVPPSLLVPPAARLPEVTNVVPPNGPEAGGTPITVSGRNFSGATDCTVGGVTLVNMVVSGNTIRGETAAGTGDAAVQVTTPAGTGGGRSFVYMPPALQSVDPQTGSELGGYRVTVWGDQHTDLTGATDVTFGGVSGTIEAVNGRDINVLTPAGTGQVDVIVVGTTAHGDVGPDGVQYSYTPPPPPVADTITPATGPTAGGTVCAIYGSGFTGATGVNFGAVAGTAFSVVDANSIAVTSPASAAGVVDVTVLHPLGDAVLTEGWEWADPLAQSASAQPERIQPGNRPRRRSASGNGPPRPPAA
jgi:hypothetical protein